MLKVKPHEFFRLDFDQIVEEGKRQEYLLTANAGELELVKNMHEFFAEALLPLILSDDWVFDAANRFASEYAIDCFRLLKLTGMEVYRAQQSLVKIKAEVQEIIDDAKLSGYIIPFTGTIELEKTSDFITLLNVNKMPENWKYRVVDLYNRTVDIEEMHVFTALRGLRDMYEISLPRIMYVVKRAIKVINKVKSKPSDNELRGISDDITWFSRYIPSNHALYPVFGKLSDFYKIARNVGNHHKGFRWEPSKNIVVLEDLNDNVEFNVTEFIQKFRYLNYVCELGVRGILSGFCEREQGEISKKMVVEYAKIFPPNWSGGEKGIVEFYS